MLDLQTSQMHPLDMAFRHTFKKAEHLYLRSEIEALFSAGSKSVNIFPIRAVYRLEKGESDQKVKVLVSVSKRRLRHAVDRNRSKRQMREAYRLQKQILWDVVPDGYSLHVGFIWLPSQLIKSPLIHRTIKNLMLRIGENIAKVCPVSVED
jgi:ribonuclease P protein component